MPRVQYVYLAVKASGDVRLNKRPRPADDEVVIPIRLEFPEGWGALTETITVTMPEPPKVEVQEIIT